MKRKPISLALGQIEVASGELDENLDRALNAVNQASRMGAQIILLPECLDFGWCSDASLKGAAPIPGPITNKLVDASRDANILIAAGLSERDGCKLYNASVLIDPVLGLVGKHRKINELDFAKAIYAGGDKVRAFNTSLGRIAIPICADLLDQSIRKEIGEIGADVILSPATLDRTRA